MTKFIIDFHMDEVFASDAEEAAKLSDYIYEALNSAGTGVRINPYVEHDPSRVYIITAFENNIQKECVVLSNLERAAVLFDELCEIYGASKVCLASLEIDTIPHLLVKRVKRKSE